MPELARLGKVLIRMFPDDHVPPHFHVVTPEGEAVVRTEDFTVLQGRISRRELDFALEWGGSQQGDARKQLETAQ